MVNGNYILYGDRPVSESEIVDDHVHSRTVERKTKRKPNRMANDLQNSLNTAQLDNETDSIKYEKRIKEPRLLRYVPTTDVEENYVSEKFETYDLKPTTEERPRRYAFTKKPKNPADGSVNYAYSRSSSSCSSPNGNLPTISEHGEQYGTYKVRSVSTQESNEYESEAMKGYENKLDKYFSRPKEVKKFAAKGSHPDSLYRVPVDSGTGGGKMTRAFRVLRWPVALIVVCVALAVFVYFLMPDSMDPDMNMINGTYWEPIVGQALKERKTDKSEHKPPELTHSSTKKKENTVKHGTRPSEIDFYDTETNNDDLTSIIDTNTMPVPTRKLPIPPVFPSHITPEVQYGNERADTEKLRTAKLLEETNTLPEDSTLKPHITQKPEKPLAIYFKEGTAATSASTETIFKAETINDFSNYGEKYSTKTNESPVKPYVPFYKEPLIVRVPEYGEQHNMGNTHQQYVKEPEIPIEVQEVYSHQPMNLDVNFTSGHSKLFGISIEDAEKMKSTTQSSLYNTRVSPTLPTWRDKDDITTKKYPINVIADAQCRSTRLALCRGVLPYDLAGVALSFNGVEITTLMEQIEYLVATNCSDRVKQFACALLEPECNPPPYPAKMPCYNLCKAIVDNCDGQIPSDLVAAFNCNQYSTNNCVAAKSPCFPREFSCGDGTCVPRDWICDGTADCPSGDDEARCVVCDANEFRCRSGGCILKRWLCDGYADCPNGEDEAEDVCESRGGRAELGEESAGSAPAPAVHKPYRLPSQGSGLHRTGENDSSKELLVTSDSTNALKRNFTRRPLPSRLTPYTRPGLRSPSQNKPIEENVKSPALKKINNSEKSNNAEKLKSKAETETLESEEDVNVDDLFVEFEKEPKYTSNKKLFDKTPLNIQKGILRGAPPPPDEEHTVVTRVDKSINKMSKNAPQDNTPVQPEGPLTTSTRLDKSLNKLERVINGATMLRKATQEEMGESVERNSTAVNKSEEELPGENNPGSMSAHASPCPSGELRCVDGRCITLAQLCDGTIDCSDHADEDNCYT
ncbi:uncharacterized protein LOC113518285 isoform X2 [Galleria mellonella]|uniref:Uncharacterized protein LOC113518285 isoform X2 n=1 Tax=Galleria mellonella TaxID=7137 RepID=A0A6J3C6S4_GALME|nr:uncharacterized protein LOC113518285 isoform X2 [Galleria mellonella]